MSVCNRYILISNIKNLMKNNNMTQQEFIVSLEEKGIVLSEKQIEQFEKYYEIQLRERF